MIENAASINNILGIKEIIDSNWTEKKQELIAKILKENDVINNFIKNIVDKNTCLVAISFLFVVS